MPETTLVSRSDITSLVAAEYVAHAEHTRQRFAQDAARTLLAMRPAAHDEATNAAASTFEAAARVVLRLAGLNPELLRTTPDGTGHPRLVLNDAEQSRTEANR